jgi:chromosome segregation ATPase
MKLFFLITLLAAAPILTQAPENITPDAVDKYNDEIIALAQSMQTDLDNEKKAHGEVSQNLATATQTLGTLQKHIDDLTTQTYEQSVTVQKQKNRILRDDIIFGVLGLVALGLVGLKFGLL